MQAQTNITTFPTQQVSTEVKKSREYGLQYARAIYARIADNYFSNYDNKRRLRINRKYAEGLQSVQKYKSLLDMDGETSYANIDWTPPPIIPKFVDILVDKFLQQDYDLICNPLDPVSKNRTSELIAGIRAAQIIKPVLDDLEKVGIENPLAETAVPETDQEADLWLQMTGKIAEAIAIEVGIKVVMTANEWKNICRQVIRDLVVCKVAGVRPYYDENNAIKLRAIDPVRLVTSWTDKPDFSNIQYFGEIIQMSISQLRDASNGELSEEELFEIAKLNSNKQGNPAWRWGNAYYPQNNMLYRPYDNYLIEVLDFSYTTIDAKKYSKKTNNKGGYYIKERSLDYIAPEGPNSKTTVYEKTIQNNYGGMFVIGTEYIFNYGLERNMIRDRKVNNLSPNVYMKAVIFAPDIYDMENKSLVERMIPFADQIAICHFKIQQLIGKAIPPGVKIDQRALESLAVGMGEGNIKPKEMVEMYTQTGNFIFRSKDAEGEIINSSAIEPLVNGVSPEIVRLTDIIEYNINMIRSVTGLNEAADSSTPDRDALIGIQKMALAASNAAVRHIKDAYENIAVRTGKLVSLMIQDLFQEGYGREIFESALGKQAVAYLEACKNFTMMDSGIEIQYKPTLEEKQELSMFIERELQTQAIRLEDAIMVKEFDNLKLAVQYLIYRKKKYQEEKMQESAMLQQQNAQVQQQSAIATKQAEAEIEKMKLDAEAQKLQIEYQLKSQLSEQEHLQKMEQLKLQGQMKMNDTAVGNMTKPQKSETKFGK
jgi:hypothetical protein